MNPSPLRHLARPLAVVALLATSIAVSLGVTVSPAAAQSPTLTVGPAVITAGQPTTVTVTGRNYFIPPHTTPTLFGGVYVLFGWVQPGGQWGPSARNGVNTNGQFGYTYTYAGESGGGETRDDGTGRSRFIAFTPGGIDAEATPYHMDAAGNWSVTLTIPSSVYTWTDPATGRAATVDCSTVQCGIYTFGAHGRASSSNEQFAPIIVVPPARGGGTTPVPTAPPAPAVTAAPAPTPAAGGSSPAPSVGGTQQRSPGATPTTLAAGATGSATDAGTVPPAPGDTTTVPADASTVPPAESTTSTSSPTGRSRGAGTDRSERGDDVATSDRITIDGDDADSGPPVWLVGAGIVGVPLVAAAGLVVANRRRTPV